SIPAERAASRFHFSYTTTDNSGTLTVTNTYLKFVRQDSALIGTFLQAGAAITANGYLRLPPSSGEAITGTVTLNEDRLITRMSIPGTAGISTPDVQTLTCSRQREPKGEPPEQGQVAAMPGPLMPQPVAAIGEPKGAELDSDPAPTADSKYARTAVDIIRAFYGALGQGDGVTANSFMSLEKRAAPAYQPDAIGAFYGHMTEPLTLVSVSAVGAGDYEVRYRYRKQSAVCNGHAIVTTQDSGGRTLIARIKPIGNC
ncbi:MAG: hypothetical protein WA624_06115, partial [Methylocella sp.]